MQFGESIRSLLGLDLLDRLRGDLSVYLARQRKTGGAGIDDQLAEPTIPNPEQYPENSSREIERGTLTGRYDALFVALLRQRCLSDGIATDGDIFEEQFRAHMNRGVLLMYHQVKSLSDLCKLAAVLQ